MVNTYDTLAQRVPEPDSLLVLGMLRSDIGYLYSRFCAKPAIGELFSGLDSLRYEDASSAYAYRYK
jgi:hypothetical protein